MYMYKKIIIIIYFFYNWFWLVGIISGFKDFLFNDLVFCDKLILLKVDEVLFWLIGV